MYPLRFEPPSHLPAPSHPSRLIQSSCLCFLSHTANSHWLSYFTYDNVSFHPTLSIHLTLPPLLPRSISQGSFFNWFSFFFFCWIFIALLAVSGCGVWCAGFPWRWSLFLWIMGCRCFTGFWSCGSWARGHKFQELWCTGLVALQQEGSSQTRF